MNVHTHFAGRAPRCVAGRAKSAPSLRERRALVLPARCTDGAESARAALCRLAQPRVLRQLWFCWAWWDLPKSVLALANVMAPRKYFRSGFGGWHLVQSVGESAVPNANPRTLNVNFYTRSRWHLLHAGERFGQAQFLRCTLHCVWKSRGLLGLRSPLT